MGFYQTIKQQYGAESVKLLKQWASINIKLSRCRNRKIFLLSCRKEGIIPTHIINNTKNTQLTLEYHDNQLSHQITEFTVKLQIKMLNLEITVTHKHLNNLERSQSIVFEKLEEILPYEVLNIFISSQNDSYERYFKRTKQNNLDKLNRLKQKAKSIFLKTKDIWIKNISDNQIPEDILQFLSLGHNFSVSPTVKDISIKRYLSDIENILFYCPEGRKNIVRSKITNVLTNFVYKPTTLNFLQTLFHKTKRFFKSNKDLIVTKSDKGNVTVIMNKKLYIEKCEDLLNDETCYIKLNRDPTSTLQQKANNLVSSLLKQKVISKEISKTLTIYDQAAPKFYGLPKIHKPVLSVRPIISSIKAPNSKLTKLITDVLTNAYNKNNKYYIKDSFEFSELVNDMSLPSHYIVISLDVVSLFSKIPYYLIEKSIKKHWLNISEHTNISQKIFLEILQFIFDSTYFRFQNIFFKQILGTPMGATISPIIAQYVMDDLLNECIPTLSFEMPFLKKYVDDLICAIPNDKITELISIFNNYDPNIQFTIETEHDQSVPFLDTLVRRNDQNKIQLDWYSKPSSSGRYINFNSYHTTKMKINVILGLRRRIERISHPEFKENNIKKLYNIMKDNSYPDAFLKKYLYNTSLITNISKNNQHNNNLINTNDPQTQKKIHYFALPYIKSVSQKIVKILEFIPDIKIAHKHINKVGNLYSKVKDKDETLKQSSVVYKIPCENCDQVYIGQTSTVLKDRITRHKSDCRRAILSCALSEHSIKIGHDFDFENSKVIIQEQNLNKRLFLEMVEISQEPLCLNKKKDIQDLSSIYENILTSN